MAKFDGKQARTNIDFDKVYLPSIAVDTVIFGFHEGKMKVLLLQYLNTRELALPGGFIKINEDLNEAAFRVLKERTSLTNIYLEQFHTFGDRSRNDDSMKRITKATGMKLEKNHFLLRRFVSVGYYALVDYTKVTPQKDALSENCTWYDLDKIPLLMQDHRSIIDKALYTLRKDLNEKLVGFNLLPETFTMAELQLLYETILGKKFLRTSFQRSMLQLGILKKVAKKMTGGAHKAPFLYRLNKR
ncbi:MAG: NUDIX domain-containing protein [Chitinophagaceae bacterium]|uniref:NUDIX hydrolase n=1 Tax=unclassified Paraflavitalea TaxID=2798305 RepID=UPI003D3574A1|nr:NUDIX domain-containing protein [Chitinophagaceae bacterium]